jgi:hypothetical protein
MPGGCINNMLELRTSTLNKGHKTKKPALSSGTITKTPQISTKVANLRVKCAKNQRKKK